MTYIIWMDAFIKSIILRKASFLFVFVMCTVCDVHYSAYSTGESAVAGPELTTDPVLSPVAGHQSRG